MRFTISSASIATVDNDTNNTTSTVGSIYPTTTTVLTDNAIANFMSSVATLSKVLQHNSHNNIITIAVHLTINVLIRKHLFS